jgi:hypothetical protein
MLIQINAFDRHKKVRAGLERIDMQGGRGQRDKAQRCVEVLLHKVGATSDAIGEGSAAFCLRSNEVRQNLREKVSKS